MLVVIDTGASTTKVAAMVNGAMICFRYPSAVLRGIASEQAGGVYCIGKTTANFQIYSVLADGDGVVATSLDGFRDPANPRRRVLLEHALSKAGIVGKANIILTQPATVIFRDGENHTDDLRDIEATLLRMSVSRIDPVSGRPIPAAWKLNQVTASVDAIWAIYDLEGLKSRAAKDSLGEFDQDLIEAGKIVAVVDIGAASTRVHYVEWTGEAMPTLHSSRYREISVGVEALIEQVDGLLVERHGFRDVIDLPQLRADPSIMVAGVRIDVAELVEEAVRTVDEELMASGLDQLIGEVEAGTVDHVLFVGGGAKVLGGIASEKLVPSIILSVKDPSLAPVRGLMKVRAALAGGGRS